MTSESTSLPDDLNKLEGQIKSEAEVVSAAVMIAIVAAAPFFKIPVLNQITSWIVHKIISLAGDQLALLAVFKKIDVTVEAKKEEYKEAVKDLKDELAMSGTDSEATKVAYENYKKRLAALIRVGRP